MMTAHINFESTARFVFRVNPRGHASAEAVLAYMKQCAARVTEPGYISTGGWVISSWREDDGTFSHYASVMTYTAEQALNRAESQS